MQLINNPNPKDWKELCQRPTASLEELMPIVRSVFEEVSRNGDTALKNYTEQFDGVSCADLALTATQIEEAINKVDESLKEAIQQAYQNIKCFREICMNLIKQ